MERRSFLTLAGLGAAPARAVAQEVARRTEDSALEFVRPKEGQHPFRRRPAGRRPHIFLITCDMVSPDHWHPGRSLHRSMEMPALAGLRGESVTFHNCFTTAPLCAPARAALATGRYTYITANGERAHDGHETILRPADVIFQEYLKAAGYRTKHAGKGHLGTQKFQDAFDENAEAWDRWAPPVYEDEDYLGYLERLGVKPHRYRKEIAGLQQDRRTPWARWGGWIEQPDGKPFPLEAQYSSFLARKAVEKLDAALAGNGGDPVYLQMDLFDPHQPFTIPAGFEERERELRGAIRLPASYERVRQNDWKRLPGEPKIYDLYRKNWGLYSAETALDYMVANALQVEVADRAIGHLLDAIRRRGLWDDALIVFTVDHGEMNTREALVDKGVYLCPDVVRVPLMVKAPKEWGLTPGSEDVPVTHLDVAPTLLEVAGVEPLARLDGESLLPLLGGKAGGRAREFFMECGWHVGVNFACAIQHRTPAGGHYLYTYNCSDEADELYDLNSDDPRNLAGQPEHRKDYVEMVRRMGAFLEADPRWRCYWHPFRLERFHDLPRQDARDVQMVKPV